MNKLQKETIAHYNRMIKYAKAHIDEKMDPYEACEEMESEIGEDWHTNSCIYCKHYGLRRISFPPICPLAVFNDKFINCGGWDNCCNGLWSKLEQVQNWKDWIEAAKEVKKYIRENG
jgi:hypothetical protein